MKELVFLLEEPSARAMLEGLLPRLNVELPTVTYMVFEGKNDLERRLTKRLQAYLNPKAHFIIIRDQDSSPDCIALKNRLLSLCVEAGRPNAIVRIFCRELESIYLSDLIAVEKGLAIKGLARMQNQARFRNPDLLASPSKELQAITEGLYQKIGGSRAIGRCLNTTNERSSSFRALLSAIQRCCEVS